MRAGAIVEPVAQHRRLRLGEAAREQLRLAQQRAPAPQARAALVDHGRVLGPTPDETGDQRAGGLGVTVGEVRPRQRLPGTAREIVRKSRRILGDAGDHRRPIFACLEDRQSQTLPALPCHGAIGKLRLLFGDDAQRQAGGAGFDKPLDGLDAAQAGRGDGGRRRRQEQQQQRQAAKERALRLHQALPQTLVLRWW